MTKTTSESSHSNKGAKPSKLTMLLIELRWLFVVPIVLPLSFLYEQVWKLRDVYFHLFESAPLKHKERVQNVVAQVKNWNSSGRKGGLLVTARKEWLSISIRPSDYKTKCNKIKVELYDILSIDKAAGIVRVEPGVTMGQLTAALLKQGLTVPVVPELDDLTVGGLISGYGIESSSHKYGLFCDTCVAYEIVLGDGTVVRATADNEYKDLFFGFPWSYGALGFLVGVEIKTIPAKPWVHLVYRPVFGKGTQEVSNAFEQAIMNGSAQGPDFVEGLMYSKDTAVIMTGRMTDSLPGPFAKTNRIGLWYKPWFYKHVKEILDNAINNTTRATPNNSFSVVRAVSDFLSSLTSISGPSKHPQETGVYEEYIPLRDYYHRHTRSIFWQGELIIPFGNHPVFRYLLGFMMPPKISFLKLTQPKSIREYHDEMMVVQDLLVPISILTKSLEFFDQTFRSYPMWLCAHKTIKTNPQGFLKPQILSSKSNNNNNNAENEEEFEMYVDVGMYYIPGVKDYHAESALKSMESWLRQNRSYQALYAQTHMTREEYRQMFDCTLYDKLRVKYGASGVFMDAYDKVCLKQHASASSR